MRYSCRTMRRYILAFSAVALFCVRAAHSASAPNWIQVSSPHFVVITNSDKDQGRKIAKQFEEMRAFFNIVLPNAANSDDLPITVFALKDEKSFRAFEPASYLAKGRAQFVGYFLTTPDRNYIALQLDTTFEHPYASIYHEYTHYVLRKNYWIPLWLNEGVAQYYQNTDIDQSEVAFGQPNFYALHFISSRLLPLTTLFAIDRNSTYYHDEDKTSIFYIESWALAHMLETSDFQQKTHRMADYDQRLSHGEDPVAAAQHAFGDLDALGKQLDSYVSQSLYQGIRMHVALDMDSSSFTVSPIAVTQVDVARADVLMHEDRRPEAQALLESVLKSEPGNARAHEEMGTLAVFNHDTAAARKWFDEAAQLDPSSYTAQYHAAQLERIEPKAEAAAEAHLQQCIKVRPTFAPAYNDLADLYLTQHRNLDEAHILTLHAMKLSPQELVYRVTAAQVLEAQQDHADAMAVLAVARSQIARTAQQRAYIDTATAKLNASGAGPGSAHAAAQ